MTTPSFSVPALARRILAWIRPLLCRGLAAAGVSIPTPLVAQVEAAAEKVVDALPTELPCSAQEIVAKAEGILENVKEAVSEAGTLAVVEETVEQAVEATESIVSTLPTSEARPASPPPSTPAEASPESAEASTATSS